MTDNNKISTINIQLSCSTEDKIQNFNLITLLTLVYYKELEDKDNKIIIISKYLYSRTQFELHCLINYLVRKCINKFKKSIIFSTCTGRIGSYSEVHQ